MTIIRISENKARASRTGVTSQNNENTGIINERFLNEPYYLNLFWKLTPQSNPTHIGYFEINVQECLKNGLFRRDNQGIRFRIVHKTNGDICLQLNLNSPSYLMGHMSR